MKTPDPKTNLEAKINALQRKHGQDLNMGLILVPIQVSKLVALFQTTMEAAEAQTRIDELKRTIQLGYGYDDDFDEYTKQRIAELQAKLHHKKGTL